MAKETVKVGGKEVQVTRAKNGELYHVTATRRELIKAIGKTGQPGGADAPK